MWQANPLSGPVDVITIRAAASQPTEASVLWQPKGGTPDQLIQAYFTVPGDGFVHDVDILVSGYPQWNWRTEQFALAFPAGTNITVEEIQFRHWTFYERIVETWRSLWTFDTYRSYSINFLWGPLVATNSVLREQMFDTLPPMGWAIGRFAYPLFIVIAIGCAVLGIMKRDRHVGIGLFFGFFALSWILFDIRMGAELVSYGVDDVDRYVFAEDTKKELRAFGDVYRKADVLLPEIRNHDRFVLLSPVTAVYFPVFRYNAYPSVIVPDAATATGVTAWAVIDRFDVWIDGSGMLKTGDRSGSGTILAGPGHKAASYDDTTFLFLVNP
jgi:hypothetical protein